MTAIILMSSIAAFAPRDDAITYRRQVDDAIAAWSGRSPNAGWLAAGSADVTPAYRRLASARFSRLIARFRFLDASRHIR